MDDRLQRPRGQLSKLQKLLGSKEFRKIRGDIEKQCGVKYIETYFSVLPSSNTAGDYDACEMWEAPNHAALDKVRKANALATLAEKTYGLTEPRPTKWVTLRAARDVKIIYKPKPKK